MNKLRLLELAGVEVVEDNTEDNKVVEGQGIDMLVDKVASQLTQSFSSESQVDEFLQKAKAEWKRKSKEM